MLNAIPSDQDKAALCIDRGAFDDANAATASLWADASRPIPPQHPTQCNDQEEDGDESEGETQKGCEVHRSRWAST